VRTRAGVLVGREPELTAALARLRGREPACFLVGEPGVGKSRLIAEITKQARADGLVVARGRASSITPVSPLRPFAEALAAIHRRGLLPDDDLGGYRPLLARVLPELPGPDRLGGAEAPPLVTFAEAVLRLLTALGGQTSGCLLVLEDLHDADPDSLAVLDYLLDNGSDSPIALLGALRDEPSGARELLETAERRSAAELLPVHPLDRTDTDLLVASCLGSERPAEQVTELAWRNTAGNPLAVEELLYHLISAGQLHQLGADWQLSPVPVVAPPPSMLELIGSRIEGLGSVSRRLVVTAAAYGEQFPLATMQAALDLGEVGFLAALQDAVAMQLVVAERPGWYRFHHPLTHAAVLELASAAERRQAASRLAEAILTEDPEPAEVTCRTAARLFAEAGQPARAGQLYARTGKLALRKGAVEWAVADLSEAFRLQGVGGPPPSELVKDLVRALGRMGQLDRALELVDRLGPVSAGPELEQRAQLHADLAWACCAAGRAEQTRQQLARARSLVAGTNNALLTLHRDTVAARLLTMHCDTVAARLSFEQFRRADPAAERMVHAIVEEAMRLARTAADATERTLAAEVADRAWISFLRYLQLRGRRQEALRYLQHAAAFAEEHGLASWVRQVAIIEQWQEDSDSRPVRALRDEARQQGDVLRALLLDKNLCMHEAMVSDGSLEPVLAGLTNCVEEARRLGHLGQAQDALSEYLAAAALRADRTAMTEALARYGLTNPPPALAQNMSYASAFCLALEGQDGEALGVLEKTQLRALGFDYISLPLGLLLLLDTLAGTAPPEQITAALGAAAGRVRWIRQFLHWAAAVAAGRRGDREEAQRHAEQAAVDAEIFPVARHLAARLVAPAAYADGWGNPIEDLRAAEAWFHERGVAVAARTCRDLLRSLGAPVQQRRDGVAVIPAELRAAGVTAREYEVGLLVREHLANREIGERLHISPRTVEKHIAGLQTKLAVPDRRALITRLADT